MDMYKGYITDIKGIKVGHSQSMQGMTGCTAIIYENGAVAGVDVRGSAPGTRETDLLKSENLIERVHCIMLAGGSAFGLDAASGAMKYLEEKGIGFDVGVTKVPIVSSAVLFDLGIGDYRIRPDFKMGYEACLSASEGEKSQGNVGAGTGATLGKALGPMYSMKSGLGSASVVYGNLIVAAIVAVNSLGDVYDFKTGKLIAGAYDKKSKALLNSHEMIKKNLSVSGFSGANTTIGVVATNAKLTKPQANKVAQMTHDGFARSINPIHTLHDGDTIFALATGEVEADVTIVGTLAAEVMSMAITNGVKAADSYEDTLAWKEI